MNESSNDSQGVSGRAVATTLGIGAGIFLGGSGLLRTRKAFSRNLGKEAKKVSKNVSKVKNIKGTQSEYLKKHYKDMVKQVKSR